MAPNYQIIDLRRPGMRRFAQATVGTVLFPLYRAAFNRRRRRYLAQRAPLPGAPVITVGNLSLGGRGKTPVTWALYSAALNAGHKGAIVLKLGREPRQFLDELLIYSVRLAQAQGAAPRVVQNEDCVCVHLPAGIVCAHRSKLEGARMMAQREDVGFVIVDDAHQLYSLEPALSICLLHPRDTRDRRFPRGMLREELAAAERADIVLMRSGEGDAERTSSLGSDFRLATEGIFPLAELLSPWVDSTGLEDAAEKNKPLGRGVAFAGIGLPQSFEDALATLEVTLAAMVRFPDHRAFTTSDLRLLAQLRERTDAGYFITTEKDGCRLLPLMLRARYAEGREVHWPEGLLPPPATSLPNLIVAAEEIWQHAFFARVAAVLPAEAVSRFREVVGA